MKLNVMAVFLGLASYCAAAPLELGLSLNGDVRMGAEGANLGAVIHHRGWRGSSHGIRPDFKFPDAQTGTATYEMFNEKELCARGRTTLQRLADGRALVDVTLAAVKDMQPEAVVLSMSMPCETFVGARWQTSTDRKGTVPHVYERQMQIFSGSVKWVEFQTVKGPAFRFTFPTSTQILIQDDRQWTQTITLRIRSNLPCARAFRAGDQRSIVCFVSSPEGVRTEIDRPVVVRAGPDWIPLDYQKNILAGSALDFSNQGLQDAPAGKYGWLRNVNGHFAFEKRPGRSQRFYGVNLCFDACFPDRKMADELVTRLARLGYNAVRIHHYESAHGVIEGSGDRLTINAARMERLDYLLARLFEKGIYVTTDLYTTRPVFWRDLGVDRDGMIDKQVYKNLIGIYEPAYRNWQTFASNLLTHVNVHTGRRYADEPALPLVSLINEGQIMWCWDKMTALPMMKDAWKNWLARRRAAEPSFAKGVSEEVSRAELAARILFMTDVERDLVVRQRAFLKALGVKALLTSQNCGAHYAPMMAMRETSYDYVDDHFYVDHPHFLGRAWSLPSKCGNGNPAFSAWLPPVSAAYTRMPDKPFTITEWNFSGPGMFRGVGGIMTGAMSALQDWDGLWRFAYSHGSENLGDRRGFPGYFDVASDPLSQASDRASVCLFLRRDLEPLADSVVQRVTPETFRPSGSPVGIVPKWLNAAWQTRVATGVAPVTDPSVRTLEIAKVKDVREAPVPLKPNASVQVDRARGAFVLDTAKTAGAFVPSGAITAGALTFDAGDVAATVWASSLDGKPITASGRILVTHLTDVQANGNVYAEKDKKILLKWGSYPPLVRNGTAKIRLTVGNPSGCAVWGLDTTGRRLARLPASAEGGQLVFTADVKGSAGARILYEIVRK